MSHFSEPIAQGIRAIMSWVASFARFNFPGTDIPIIAFFIGGWTLYFLWRWVLSQIFDMETKK